MTKRKPKPKPADVCGYAAHRASGWDWRLLTGTDGEPRDAKTARWQCGLCHRPAFPLLEAAAVEFKRVDG